MCLCNPNIRTMFCGKGLCQWPKPEGLRDPDSKRGLYRKFSVERLDCTDGPGGKHEDCQYYVLDINHDKFAWPALHAYATACEAEYPELAKDIRALLVRKCADCGRPFDKDMHECYGPPKYPQGSGKLCYQCVFIDPDDPDSAK